MKEEKNHPPPPLATSNQTYDHTSSRTQQSQPIKPTQREQPPKPTNTFISQLAQKQQINQTHSNYSQESDKKSNNRREEGVKTERDSVEENKEEDYESIEEQFNKEYKTWTGYLKDSLKMESFAGFDIHSEETLNIYFPMNERGKWLKKLPQELTVKDIPALLFDYQQLAGEHFMLLEQFQSLKNVKKEE